MSWFIPLEEARTQSQDQLAIHFKTLAPMILSIFLAGLVSTVCLTVLNSISHMRTVSIYYICGMNWASHMITCAIFTGIQIAAVSLLMWLSYVFNMSAGFLPMDAIRLNHLNVFVTLSIFLIIILTSLISQYYINKNETPLKYIRESW